MARKHKSQKNPQIVGPSQSGRPPHSPPFILWFPRFLGLSVFAGLGIMRNYYLLGIVIVYVGFLFLLLEISIDPWLLKQSISIQVIGIAILVVFVDLFAIGIVGASAPIECQTYAMRNGNYSDGTDIGGIIWNSHFTDLRVALTNPSNDDYENLDLAIQPDQWSYKAVILTESSGCDLSPIDGNLISFAIAKESGPLTMKATRVGRGFETYDSSGNTYTTLATQSGYRLRCGQLPEHFTIRMAFAVVGVSSLQKILRTPNGPAGTWGIGAAEFSNTISTFDTLDPRPSPVKVSMTGNYFRKVKPFTLTEVVAVGDAN